MIRLIKYIYVPKEMCIEKDLFKSFAYINKCKIQGQEYYVYFYSNTEMFLSKFSKEEIPKLMFRNTLIFT